MICKTFLVLATSLLMATKVYAVGSNVDASAFDIAGLKIGMDFDEARQIAAQRLNVPLSEMKIYSNSNKYPLDQVNAIYRKGVALIEQRRIDEARQLLSGAPSSFAYATDKTLIQAEFTFRIPFDQRRPLALTKIEYAIPFSAQNSEMMSKVALDRFGTPSIVNDRQSYPRWCVMAKYDCNGFFPVLSLSEYSPFNILMARDLTPKLKLQSNSPGIRWISLKLDDPRPVEAAEKALNQLAEEQKAVKPNF